MFQLVLTFVSMTALLKRRHCQLQAFIKYYIYIFSDCLYCVCRPCIHAVAFGKQFTNIINTVYIDRMVNKR
jgi:hypothetical protein